MSCGADRIENIFATGHASTLRKEGRRSVCTSEYREEPFRELSTRPVIVGQYDDTVAHAFSKQPKLCVLLYRERDTVEQP